MLRFRQGLGKLQPYALSHVIKTHPVSTSRRSFAKGHKTSEQAGLGRGWYFIPHDDDSMDHLSEEDKIIKCFEHTKMSLGLTGSAFDWVLEEALSSKTGDMKPAQSMQTNTDADLDKTFGDFTKDQMHKLLLEAVNMPIAADLRYQMGGEGPQERESYATPEETRALSLYASELGFNDEGIQLLNSNLDWIMFTTKVIQFWNDFQTQNPIKGVELVPLRYTDNRVQPGEYAGKTDKELIDMQMDLGAKIDPERIGDVVKELPTTSEEGDDLYHHWEGTLTDRTRKALGDKPFDKKEFAEEHQRQEIILGEEMKAIADGAMEAPLDDTPKPPTTDFKTDATREQLEQFAQQQQVRKAQLRAASANIDPEIAELLDASSSELSAEESQEGVIDQKDFNQEASNQSEDYDALNQSEDPDAPSLAELKAAADSKKETLAQDNSSEEVSTEENLEQNLEMSIAMSRMDAKERNAYMRQKNEEIVSHLDPVTRKLMLDALDRVMSEVGYSMHNLPERFHNPLHDIKYDKDHPKTFNHFLNPSEAHTLLLRVNERASFEVRMCSDEEEDTEEKLWSWQTGWKEDGDEMTTVPDPNKLTFHYFHQLIDGLPDQAIEGMLGPKNGIFNPAEFWAQCEEIHRHNKAEMLNTLPKTVSEVLEDASPTLTKGDLIRMGKHGKSIQDVDHVTDALLKEESTSSDGDYSAEPTDMEPVFDKLEDKRNEHIDQLFGDRTPVLVKEINAIEAIPEAERTPFQKVQKILYERQLRLKDVPETIQKMANGVFMDSIPEERRLQFIRFKEMLHEWTSSHELREQQYGVNEPALIQYREKLMNEFDRIVTGRLDYNAEKEHMDPYQDSRDLGSRLRVALPEAHAKAVMEMSKFKREQSALSITPAVQAQIETDAIFAQDPNMAYTHHMKDLGLEHDAMVESLDKRFDQTLREHWAFTESSEDLDEKPFFAGGTLDRDERSVRRELEQSDEHHNPQTSDDWENRMFEAQTELAEMTEKMHGRKFEVDKGGGAEVSSEENYMFNGIMPHDFSLGKYMGQGRDFVENESLSFDPFAEHQFTDEQLREYREFGRPPISEEVAADFNNPNDIRTLLPKDAEDLDNIDDNLYEHMGENLTLREAYERGLLDPTESHKGIAPAENYTPTSGMDAVKSYGASGHSSLYGDISAEEGPVERGNHNANPEERTIPNGLDMCASEAWEAMMKVHDNRSGYGQQREQYGDPSAIKDLTKFAKSEAARMRQVNADDTEPMNNERTTEKLMGLAQQGYHLINVPEINDFVHQSEIMKDPEVEREIDETDVDEWDDERLSTYMDEQVKEAKIPDDATDEDFVPTTSQEEHEEGSNESEGRDSEDSWNSSEEIDDQTGPKNQRPVRGEGNDPYYDIWDDAAESAEEVKDSVKRIEPKSRSGLDAWGPQQWQDDAEDFVNKTETPEWSQYNYTDPSAAAFFQEFNPHDFEVPKSEQYVFDSKDPYDRPWRLSDEVKVKMYELHKHDPTVWHARTLAPLFKISAGRADAILKLQALEAKYIEMGYPTFSEDPREEVMWPSANAAWDYPYVPSLQQSAPVKLSDEVKTFDLMERERSRANRLKNLAQRLTDVEKEYHKEMGAYGDEVPERQAPKKLDPTVFHPTRFDWVMTDISDSANCNFSIAVRDKGGDLREPNETEYDIVRRREKRKQDPFYYIQYQGHIDNVYGKRTTAKWLKRRGLRRSDVVGDTPIPDFTQRDVQALAEMD